MLRKGYFINSINRTGEPSGSAWCGIDLFGTLFFMPLFYLAGGDDACIEQQQAMRSVYVIFDDHTGGHRHSERRRALSP